MTKEQKRNIEKVQDMLDRKEIKVPIQMVKSINVTTVYGETGGCKYRFSTDCPMDYIEMDNTFYGLSKAVITNGTYLLCYTVNVVNNKTYLYLKHVFLTYDFNPMDVRLLISQMDKEQ